MNAKSRMPSLDDDDAYAAATLKLAGLRNELAKVSARRETVLNGLNAATIDPRRIDAITAAAYKLLGDDTATAGASASALREELAEQTEKLQVLDTAVGIQKATVDALRGIASRAAISQVLPVHRAAVVEIVKSILSLDCALAVEHNLTDELRQRGISLGELRPMPLHGFGTLSDPNSRASGFVLEAFEYGFIGLDEVPASIRAWARAKKAKPARTEPVRAGDSDGWIGA